MSISFCFGIPRHKLNLIFLEAFAQHEHTHSFGETIDDPFFCRRAKTRKIHSVYFVSPGESYNISLVDLKLLKFHLRESVYRELLLRLTLLETNVPPEN